MNKHNIRHTISLLEKTPNEHFSINRWIRKPPYNYSKPTLHSVRHTCGMTACIGGLVGLSPRWKNIGGYSYKHSPHYPIIEINKGKTIYLGGVDAMAWYWDVPDDTAARICLPYFYHHYQSQEETKKEAIKRLTALLNRTDLHFGGRE